MLYARIAEARIALSILSKLDFHVRTGGDMWRGQDSMRKTWLEKISFPIDHARLDVIFGAAAHSTTVEYLQLADFERHGFFRRRRESRLIATVAQAERQWLNETLEKTPKLFEDGRLFRTMLFRRMAYIYSCIKPKDIKPVDEFDLNRMNGNLLVSIRDLQKEIAEAPATHADQPDVMIDSLNQSARHIAIANNALRTANDRKQGA